MFSGSPGSVRHDRRTTAGIFPSEICNSSGWFRAPEALGCGTNASTGAAPQAATVASLKAGL
jgi:hypothetical protein